MKRYNILNEDFFDDEDIEELTHEEVEEKVTYENTLSLCHYLPSNKNTLGRQSIDILPLVRIIKQFFSIVQSLRFVGNYSTRIWFLGIDLIKPEIMSKHNPQDLFTEIDNERITEKDYLKNICYKLYDIYEESTEVSGTMNISLTIQLDFEAVLVPFKTFLNDFRKLQRYGIGVAKLGCLSGLGVKNPLMNFYKGGLTTQVLWQVDSDHFDNIWLRTVWDLATKIFGTNNKYYNKEEKDKLENDESGKLYSRSLDLTCPNFLKKMALYFKRRQDHYLCDIIGYNCASRGIDIVVYLDVKDYDSLTVKNITDYMKELFDKFNIYNYSEMKHLATTMCVWISCYELPEKRPGKKAELFNVDLGEQYPFRIFLGFVDNESGEFRQYHDSEHTFYEKDPFRIRKSIIQPAIKNYKTVKDEISKIK